MKTLHCIVILLIYCSLEIRAQNYSAPSGAGNSGTDNTSVGSAAGDVVTGSYNSFLGKEAGKANTSANYNSFIGYRSGYTNITGTNNTYVGYFSGHSNTNSNNVFIGSNAGRFSSSGGNNTFVGSSSGYNIGTGAGNVFIGNSAGYNETGSNKLYIDNSGTTTPLIYGDFSMNQVGINSSPNSTHALTIGGTVHATGFYVNGIAIPNWGVSGSNISYTSGNVSIGTTVSPVGYKLAVGGKLIAEEVVVKLQTSWPDYVFEKDYKLPSLEELQLFINEHNHLPGIASAKEVQDNGINLGELNTQLVKKIEELTLYIIDLKKEVDLLKKNQK